MSSSWLFFFTCFDIDVSRLFSIEFRNSDLQFRWDIRNNVFHNQLLVTSIQNNYTRNKFLKDYLNQKTSSGKRQMQIFNLILEFGSKIVWRIFWKWNIFFHSRKDEFVISHASRSLKILEPVAYNILPRSKYSSSSAK